MASSGGALVEVDVMQEEGKGTDHMDSSSSLGGLGRAGLMNKKPRVPENFHQLLTKPRLKALKQYIGSYQYRLNAQTNFNAHKLRPLARIMDTARMIVYAPQPIKCVEAVFVALYLTAGLPDVERVPLGFKTELLGQHGGKWGAFGISRCPDLMNKDLIFDSMSSVIENFKIAYESQGHIVLKVRVGLPVEHSIKSPNFVCWRHLNLNLQYTSWSECVDEIDKHAAKGKRLWDLWVLSGKGEGPHKASAIRKAPLDKKVSPFNEKAKKKKLASRDATPMKAKSIVIEHSEVPSSSCTHAESSSKPTTLVAVPESEPTPKTTLVAPCPATIGNSKFRNRPKTGQSSSSSSSSSSVATAKGTKMTAGAFIDQMLTASQGLLRTKYFK